MSRVLETWLDLLPRSLHAVYVQVTSERLLKWTIASGVCLQILNVSVFIAAAVSSFVFYQTTEFLNASPASNSYCQAVVPQVPTFYLSKSGFWNTENEFVWSDAWFQFEFPAQYLSQSQGWADAKKYFSEQLLKDSQEFAKLNYAETLVYLANYRIDHSSGVTLRFVTDPIEIVGFSIMRYDPVFYFSGNDSYVTCGSPERNFVNGYVMFTYAESDLGACGLFGLDSTSTGTVYLAISITGAFVASGINMGTISWSDLEEIQAEYLDSTFYWYHDPFYTETHFFLEYNQAATLSAYHNNRWIYLKPQIQHVCEFYPSSYGCSTYTCSCDIAGDTGSRLCGERNFYFVFDLYVAGADISTQMGVRFQPGFFNLINRYRGNIDFPNCTSEQLLPARRQLFLFSHVKRIWNCHDRQCCWMHRFGILVEPI